MRTVLIPVAEAAICQEALRRRRPDLDTKDVLQEVLMHLCEDGWARLRGFDPARGSLAGFLSTVARNFTIDRLRRPRPPEPVEDVELVQADAPPDSGPEGKVRLGEALDRLAAALDEGDLLLLRWLWFEDMDRAEIAERLGVSAAALYKRSQRLEAKVRAFFSNDEVGARSLEGARS